MISLETAIAALCLIFVCICIAYFTVKFIWLLINRSRQQHIQHNNRITHNRQQTLKTMYTFDFYAK